MPSLLIKSAITAAMICFSSFAIADDNWESWFISKSKVDKLRQEMKRNPVQPQKVKVQLERITSLVRAKHEKLISDLNLSIEDQASLVTKGLALNFLVKSPLFNQMFLKIYAKEDIGALLFYNVDTVGFDAEIDINSYDTLKSFVLRELEESNLSVEEVLASKEGNCADQVRSNSGAFLRFLCTVVRSLLTTNNFSEWLIAMEAPLKETVKTTRKAIRKQVGYFDFFTGAKGYTCNQNSWFCRGQEYLHAQFVANGAGVGRIDLGITIYENRLKLNVSLSAKRQLAEFLQGRFSDQVTGIDLLKYKVLKHIENMSDQQIENAALELSRLISSAEELAQGKGNSRRLVNP